MSVAIERYSERSIVVRGDTRPHKDSLKDMGGVFNRGLKNSEGVCSPGWIFSIKREASVTEWLRCIENGHTPRLKTTPPPTRPARVSSTTSEVLEQRITTTEQILSKICNVLDINFDSESESDTV